MKPYLNPEKTNQILKIIEIELEYIDDHSPETRTAAMLFQSYKNITIKISKLIPNNEEFGDFMRHQLKDLILSNK